MAEQDKNKKTDTRIARENDSAPDRRSFAMALAGGAGLAALGPAEARGLSSPVSMVEADHYTVVLGNGEDGDDI